MTGNKSRQIAQRLSGTWKGRIRRLISPIPEGEMLKPFVFLDQIDSGEPVVAAQGFPIHPHSGIATLSYLFEGSARAEDSTSSAEDLVEAGGFEWLYAGKGVWHKGTPEVGRRIRGFQLWLALPADQQLAPAHRRYVHPRDVPREGPVRILLGCYNGTASAIPTLPFVNYFAVELAEGERWCHQPQAGHDVAWLALSQGELQADGAILKDQACVFDNTDRPIEVIARTAASFVFGSSPKHPHDLVVGDHSVHTSLEALREAERELSRYAGATA